jgi:superfamily II DNA or RNA helicase
MSDENDLETLTQRNELIDGLLTMGFERNLCEQAIDIFNDDVNSASEWILRQNTLGQMPKRFKENRTASFNFTFYNSRVRLDPDDYVVTDYEAAYNIVLIESRYGHHDGTPDPKWVSLSDPSLWWLEEKHDSKPTVDSVTGMKHFLGTIRLPVYDAFHNAPGAFNDSPSYQRQQGTWFTNELLKRNSQGQPFGNLPSMYNRARVIAAINPFLAFRWQSLLYYCDKHNETLRLTPNAPEPPGVSTRRIRQSKCKLWTKMQMILEVNGVDSEDRQNISTAERGKAAIMGLIRPYNLDSTIVHQILQLYQDYRNTRTYLRKEKKQWQDACASVFTVTDAAFVGQGTEGSYFQAKLWMNDLIFKEAKGMYPESNNWIHLRNVMNVGFNTTIQVVNTSIFKCLYEGFQTHSWYSHYAQITLPQWGKVTLDWSHREEYIVKVGTRKSYWAQPHMMAHQQQAMGWMYTRERAVADGDLGTVYDGWKEHTLDSGFVFYRHTMGNIINQTQYEALTKQPTGGILAQSVGAGKTSEILMLISHMKRMHNEQEGKTLVIVPTTMLGTWEHEIEKWTPELIVNVYYGNRRSIPLEDESDIILTSYRTICSELASSSGPLKHDDLKKHQYRRIILDEGHHIRDMTSKTFKAINDIPGNGNQTRWVVTATPIVKGVGDLCAYLTFMRVFPWVCGGLVHSSYMRRSVNSIMWTLTSYAESYPFIAYGLKNMIGSVMFYQSKKSIQTISGPEHFSRDLTDTTVTIVPEPTHLKMLNTLQKMIDKRVKSSQRMTYAQRLRLMKWLREAAMHPTLVPLAAYGNPLQRRTSNGTAIVTSTIEGVNLDAVDDKFAQTVKNTLTKLDEERCPICLDSIDTPTVTACGHIFCSECINNAFNHQPTNKRCPCCRSTLNGKVLREIKLEGNVDDTGDSIVVEHPHAGASEISKELKQTWDETYNMLSPKIAQLTKWFEENPNEKALVFTSMTSNIVNTIMDCLKIHDIDHVAITGNMTKNQRTKAIKHFQNNESCRAFILTTRSASFGLTLTAASTVIFFEPCMNRSLRNQCIGRMDRLSQKSKKLSVITFAVENSIEEKLADIVKVKNWSFKDVGL